MPTYQYECRRCGNTFEEFKPITAPSRSRCPKCRGKVQRLVTGGAGILFKGSGFYATDSRSGRSASRTACEKASAAAAAESKSTAAKKSGGDSPAKTDAKPAAKGSTKS